MSETTVLERRLARTLARITTPRAATIVIATASATVTLVAGVLITAVDHTNFSTFGAGLWWAVQTVTTVGYGDHVPRTTAGRLVAAFVMLWGIGSLTMVTATITSSFVARSGIQHPPADAPSQDTDQFARIEQRLERIEAALTGRS